MANIPEGADYRLSVFDRQGRKQDELTATFHCIWTLMPNIGTAYFTLATNDPKCTYENCLPGRYILFEHQELGNWGGVISPHNQRKWSGEKQITIPVVAAEYQFNRRRAGSGVRLDAHAGAVFRSLCNSANSEEDALIRHSNGNIWGGGDKSGVEDLKDGMMSDIMTAVVAKTGVDWWLEPEIDPLHNRLVFSAYLSRRRGMSDNYVLKEGFNIETPSGDFYTEEGYLVNDAMVIGAAAKNGEAQKGAAIDKASISEFGLWQSSERIGSAEAGGAQGQADTKIADSSQMKKKYMLTALESPESPDTFLHLKTGNIVTLDMYSVGFFSTGGFGADEKVRILSREYTTEDNKVILVTQVR